MRNPECQHNNNCIPVQVTPYELNDAEMCCCPQRPPGGAYLVPPDAAPPKSTLQEKQRQDERRCEWFVDRKDDLNATNAKELISRIIAKLGLGLRDQYGEIFYCNFVISVFP